MLIAEKVRTTETVRIPDCQIIRPDKHFDNRGKFQKIYNDDFYREQGINEDFKEIYYSKSHKGVLRGLHFQSPPNEHAKLVTCVTGSIIDIILDLRKGSPTFGKKGYVKISRNEFTSIYIPRGCAHGFLSLEDNTIVANFSTSVYSPDHDCSINPFDNYIGSYFNNIIMSNKDKDAIEFKDFNSPFVFKGDDS